ncbi:MAG: glycosyltransferase family protein, partial [Candidatus Thorarchaeota archaeon]
ASTEGIVSLPADNDLPGYLDVRPFQYGGAGALLLQRVNPGMEHVFDVENQMVGFRGYDAVEAKERFEQVVETDEDCRRRNELFSYVQAEHTYERRIETLVEFLHG